MKKLISLFILTSIFIIALSMNGCTNFKSSEKLKLSNNKNLIELNNKDNNQINNSAQASNKQANNRLPGEFEKQQAIWLQWPSAVYNSANRPLLPPIIEIIKALSSYELVNVMVANTDEKQQIKALLKQNGINLNNVRFYVINHLSIWTRDVGPIFVKDNKNKLKVANFGFNNYSRDGSQYYIDLENQIDRLAAQSLQLPVINSSLISEGGAIESNGKGTLMTTEAVVLKRNSKLTKQQIENEYKRVLGVKKIIWLKKGLPEDDHVTGGHINELARFANSNTILLAEVQPNERFISSISQESYKRLEENYKILQSATDQDGKRFRIIRIPMPPSFYQKAKGTGPTPLRSYLNYAVINGAVLLQTYYKPGRPSQLKTTEKQVINTFQKIFPGRNIIGIDAENINIWGGGIHCITQHMPAY